VENTRWSSALMHCRLLIWRIVLAKGLTTTPDVAIIDQQLPNGVGTKLIRLLQNHLGRPRTYLSFCSPTATACMVPPAWRHDDY
jgi:hypothetical protein